MKRTVLIENILRIFKEEFDIIDPGLDDNLSEEFEFDSIDVIMLLEHLENLLGSKLTQEEKKQALNCRTINHMCDYIENVKKNIN